MAEHKHDQELRLAEDKKRKEMGNSEARVNEWVDLARDKKVNQDAPVTKEEIRAGFIRMLEASHENLRNLIFLLKDTKKKHIALDQSNKDNNFRKQQRAFDKELKDTQQKLQVLLQISTEMHQICHKYDTQLKTGFTESELREFKKRVMGLLQGNRLSPGHGAVLDTALGVEDSNLIKEFLKRYIDAIQVNQPATESDKKAYAKNQSRLAQTKSVRRKKPGSKGPHLLQGVLASAAAAAGAGAGPGAGAGAAGAGADMSPKALFDLLRAMLQQGVIPNPQDLALGQPGPSHAAAGAGANLPQGAAAGAGAGAGANVPQAAVGGNVPQAGAAGAGPGSGNLSGAVVAPSGVDQSQAASKPNKQVTFADEMPDAVLKRGAAGEIVADNVATTIDNLGPDAAAFGAQSVPASLANANMDIDAAPFASAASHDVNRGLPGTGPNIFAGGMPGLHDLPPAPHRSPGRTGSAGAVGGSAEIKGKRDDEIFAPRNLFGLGPDDEFADSSQNRDRQRLLKRIELLQNQLTARNSEDLGRIGQDSDNAVVIAALRAEIARLQKRLEDSQSEYSIMEARHQGIEDSLRHEAEGERRHASDLQARLDELKAELAKVSSRLAAVQTDDAEQLANNAVLSDTKARLEQQIRDLQLSENDKKRALELAADERTRSLQTAADDWRRQFEEQERRWKDRFDQAARDHEARFNEQAALLRSAEQRYSTEHSSHVDDESRHTSLESDLKREVETLGRQLLSAQDARVESETQLRLQRETYEQRNEENLRVRLDVATKDARIAALEAELALLRQRPAAPEPAAAGAGGQPAPGPREAKRESEQQQIERLTLNVINLTAEKEKNTLHINQLIDAANTQERIRVSNARELAELRAREKELLDRLQAEAQALSAAKEQLAAAKTHGDHLERELKTVSADANSLKKLLEEATHDLNQLRTQLVEREAARNAAVLEVNRLAPLYAEEQQRVQVLNERLTASERAHQETRARAAADLAQMRLQFEQARQRADAEHATVVRLNTQVANLNSTVNGLKGQITKLTGEYHDMAGSYTAAFRAARGAGYKGPL